MISKQQKHYLFIGMIPITLYIFYTAIAMIKISLSIMLSKLLSLSSILTFNIFSPNLKYFISSNILFTNTDVTIDALHLSSNQDFSLAINTFISGFFYGITFLGVIASIIIYGIFKQRKWLTFITLSILIAITFLVSDIFHLFNYITCSLDSFLQAVILSASIFFLSILLTSYYPFKWKKAIYQSELKLYSLLVISTVILYFSGYLYDIKHSLAVDIGVLIVFITSLNINRKLKNNRTNGLYIVYIILICILLGLCSIEFDLDDTSLNIDHTLPYIKIYITILIILSIINNYALIKKYQEHNKMNRQSMLQYMLMLKNYHKLLVDEKNSHNTKEADIISLKDHKGDLSFYLKDHYKLTDREIDVLYLIWNGMTNKEIAHELNITISTTKYHISNIYLKLNVNSRAQVFALKDW